MIITVLAQDSCRKCESSNVYAVEECFALLIHKPYRKFQKSICFTIPGQNRPWSKPVVRITAEGNKNQCLNPRGYACALQREKRMWHLILVWVPLYTNHSIDHICFQHLNSDCCHNSCPLSSCM